MSAGVIKIIAFLAMIADHSATVLSAKGLLPSDLAWYLHLVGRFSFPAFALLVAEGWQHTSNPRHYFMRLVLFAFISQIPYSVALSFTNLYGENLHSSYFRLASIPIALGGILLIVMIWTGLKSFVYSDKIILTCNIILIITRLRIFGIQILDSSQNILFTLVISIIVLYISDLIKKSYTYSKRQILYLTIALLLLLITVHSDYQLFGPLMILFLYLHNNKISRCFTICLWGVCTYIFSFDSVVAIIFFSVLLSFYNGEKGIFSKWIFYFGYPIHLLILCLFNVYYHLNIK